MEDAIGDRDITGNLDGLTFPTFPSMVQFMKRWAALAWFQLIASTALDVKHVQFHCWKGSKCLPKDGVLCPCYFRFSRREDGTVVLGKYVVEHNHVLVPEVFRERVLDSESLDIIREMYNAGVQPGHIQKVMISRGELLTTLQICAVAKRDSIASFAPESIELAHFMESSGGICERFVQVLNGREQTVALFTQTAQEKRDLNSLADLVFMDGTHAQLRMRWEIIPITLINGEKQLVCGGIAFAAFFTAEDIEWLLEQIWRSSPDVADIWRTIVTDEDSAFLPAMENFLRDKGVQFAHVLCAMHKMSNFTKKLNRTGQSSEVRKRLTKLFEVVRYTDHRGICDSALKDIEDHDIERLNKYIRKHVRPILDNFAMSHLCEVFSAGYNTSSCAESCNRMLKKGLSNRLCSLREARQHFDLRLENHRRMTLAKSLKRRSAECSELEDQLELRLSRTISEEILKEEKRSLDMEIREDDGHWDVYSLNRPEVIYSVTTEEAMGIQCSCGKVQNAGYPCRHILAVLRGKGEPCTASLLNPRWIARQSGPSHPDREADPDPLDEVSDDSDEAEATVENPESDLEESIPVTLGLGLEDATHNLVNMSERNVYLTVWHFAKGVSSLASRSVEKAEWFMLQLQVIRERLLADEPLVPEEHEGFTRDVQDAQARTKGRPSRQQVAANVTRSAQNRIRGPEITACPICDEAHAIADCEYFAEVAEVREANSEIERPGAAKRCAVCLAWGHTKRTCEHRIRAKEIISAQKDEDE
jgi:hypothetical protein